MNYKKIAITILVIILINVIFLYLGGYTFSEQSSIQTLDWHKNSDIEILLNKELSHDKAVLFKDINLNKIGVAKLQNKYNILWKVISYTYVSNLEKDVPFEITENHTENSKEENQLIIGFHTNDKTMKILICGPKEDNIEEMLRNSNLDLNKFAEENPQYSIADIKNGYSLITQKKFEVINWNFYTFNEDGYLIATKIAGSGKSKYFSK